MVCTRGLVFGIALVSIGASGCKHGGDVGGDAGDVVSTASLDAGATPKDQLAPGELVEGTESAFGLPLPAAMKVGVRVGTNVTARGKVTVEQLAAYVQKKVTSGTAKIGKYESTFTDVKPIADPSRPLLISIHTDNRDVFTIIDVQDDTQLPIAPIPTTEAYKQNGISRDNKLTNPLDLR